MNTLPTLLTNYGFGERQLNEEDFYAICEQEGIEVIWSQKKYSFYFHVLDKHCIVLPKRKRGLPLLFAMYHELGHYLLHIGDDMAASFLNGKGKDELEADAVALIALIPKHRISEMAAEFGLTRYGDKLWRERCKLYFLYDV